MTSDTHIDPILGVARVKGASHTDVAPPSIGELGYQVDSMAAKKEFEQTVDRDPALRQDPQLSAALDSLRTIVNLTHIDASAHQTDLTGVTNSASDVSIPVWS